MYYLAAHHYQRIFVLEHSTRPSYW